jgi:hypothetical protein
MQFCRGRFIDKTGPKLIMRRSEILNPVFNAVLSFHSPDRARGGGRANASGGLPGTIRKLRRLRVPKVSATNGSARSRGRSRPAGAEARISRRAGHFLGRRIAPGKPRTMNRRLPGCSHYPACSENAAICCSLYSGGLKVITGPVLNSRACV